MIIQYRMRKSDRSTLSTGVAALLLIPLSACSWFGHHRRPPPDPTEIIVSGAVEGSLVLIDGNPSGKEALKGRPLVVGVAPGDHTIEIQLGAKIVYREDLFLAAGEHRTVRVLSGSSR